MCEHNIMTLILMKVEVSFEKTGYLIAWQTNSFNYLYLSLCSLLCL